MGEVTGTVTSPGAFCILRRLLMLEVVQSTLLHLSVLFEKERITAINNPLTF